MKAKAKPDDALMQIMNAPGSALPGWSAFYRAFRGAALAGDKKKLLWMRVEWLLHDLSEMAVADDEAAASYVALASEVTRRAMFLMQRGGKKLRADSEAQVWFPWLKSRYGDAPGWEDALSKLNASARIARPTAKSRMDAVATRTVANMVSRIQGMRDVFPPHNRPTFLQKLPQFKMWMALPPLNKATAKRWYDKALKSMIEDDFAQVENTPYGRNLAARYTTRGRRMNAWRRDCLQALKRLAPE